jgi:hypothetical protein
MDLVFLLSRPAPLPPVRNEGFRDTAGAHDGLSRLALPLGFAGVHARDGGAARHQPAASSSAGTGQI